MSIARSILRPVGSIKSSAVRRIALVIYAAPLCAISYAVQLVQAPAAVLLIFTVEACAGIWRAARDSIACAVISTIEEPGRWRLLAVTIARIWRVDRATWLAEQPQLIVRNPRAEPTP